MHLALFGASHGVVPLDYEKIQRGTDHGRALFLMKNKSFNWWENLEDASSWSMIHNVSICHLQVRFTLAIARVFAYI